MLPEAVSEDGSLRTTILSTKLCDTIIDGRVCEGEENYFEVGREFNLLFLVESSVVEGKVQLVRNYIIKDPSGNIILSDKREDSYNFEVFKKRIYFTDEFSTTEMAESGKYTINKVLKDF